VLTASVVYWSEFLAADPEAGFDSRRYHIFWEVVGLERGLLNHVSTIKELRERKVAARSRNWEYGRRDPSHWPRDILYPQHLALT
jgi:hypothetical protein